jgi:hypothetical protein
MQDVVGATVALTRAEWLSQRAMLIADGYQVTEDLRRVRVEGDVLFEVLFVEPTHTGVRRIRFGLSAAPGSASEECLGSSRLGVGPDAYENSDLPQR